MVRSEIMDSFTPNGTIGRLQVMPGTCELEKPEKILTKPPGICDEWLKRATEEYESKSWWDKQLAVGLEAGKTRTKDMENAEDFKKNCDRLPDEIPEKYINDLRQQLNDYVNGKARWMDPEYTLGLRGALPLLEDIYYTGPRLTASPPPFTEAEKEWIAKQQNDIDMVFMGIWAAPGLIARMAGVSEQRVKEVNEQIGVPMFDMLTAHMSVREWRSPGAVGKLSKVPVWEPLKPLRDGVRITRGQIEGYAIINNGVMEHSGKGTWTEASSMPPKNRRTFPNGRLASGGHGQSAIEELQKRGIPYNIEHTYPNGVRVGNIPNHTVKAKRSGTNQSWFPEGWSDDDIRKAGQIVLNSPCSSVTKLPSGGTMTSGIFKGVYIRVVIDPNGGGSIFPDNNIQP
ncbi:EndoU domain-containing protein [Salmonella enterica]|nr:EndoU domain-containing protein [Salmonella enterica]EJU7772490.1 EndoU domain-containing protein [Salmonella enterica subsp. salamae serovar 4,12:e,n,x:1,6]HCM1996622.1 EndoU domain-containing protein [Salmonella enterica subsp. salamae serovar 53:z4,z24:-]